MKFSFHSICHDCYNTVVYFGSKMRKRLGKRFHKFARLPNKVLRSKIFLQSHQMTYFHGDGLYDLRKSANKRLLGLNVISLALPSIHGYFEESC